MREVELTDGYIALVDDEDYERVRRHQWWALVRPNTVYARSEINGRLTKMHRFILNASDDLVVDHIDGDGLNNTRANLRLATRRQNQGNRRKQPGSSRYKGVTWVKRDQKWRAQIQMDGKQKSLGHFTSEEEAARVYDQAARKYWGEFALVNFPGETSTYSL